MSPSSTERSSIAFTHSSWATQGMPDWQTDEQLLWKLGSYEAMGSCGNLTPPAEYRKELCMGAADSPSGRIELA